MVRMHMCKAPHIHASSYAWSKRATNHGTWDLRPSSQKQNKTTPKNSFVNSFLGFLSFQRASKMRFHNLFFAISMTRWDGKDRAIIIISDYVICIFQRHFSEFLLTSLHTRDKGDPGFCFIHLHLYCHNQKHLTVIPMEWAVPHSLTG